LPSAHTFPPWRWNALDGGQADARPFELIDSVKTLKSAKELLCMIHIESCTIYPLQKTLSDRWPLPPRSRCGPTDFWR